MRKSTPPFLLLLALLTSGCTAFAPETDLRIVLPAPPAQWSRAFPTLGARIILPDAAGRVQETVVRSWQDSIEVSCPKTGTTPVLAFPRTSDGGGALRPAGALFPQALGGDGRTLELSWADGALAHVILLLRVRGIDCSLFNTQRLCGYFRRCQDPWDLDLNVIAQKIALGDFNAYDIDALPGRDQALRPGDGEWFLESPFGGVLVPDEQGAVTLRGLSDGVHTLFSVGGEEIRLAASSLGLMVSRIR